MKNLFVISMVVILTILSFTSCQKEQVLTTLETEKLDTKIDFHTLNFEKTMDPNDLKSKIETKGISYTDQAAPTQITSPRALRNMAKSRTSFVYNDIILCRDTITSTNQNKGNDIIGDVYKNQGCLNSSYGYTGSDVGYLLWVEDAGTFELQLNHHSADLDIFLFSLDQNGDLDKCLGYSVNGGTQSEYINASLGLGVYAVIVDGYQSYDVSNFSLNVDCMIIPMLFNCDDLEYNNGALTTMAPDWVKYWSSSSDATITSTRSHSGTKSAHFEDYNDVVNLLGKEYINGVHYYSWEVYIPSGKNGAFGFEKYNQPGKEASIRVFMNNDESIHVYAKGQAFNSPFTYPQDQWITIDVTYSLNSGQCCVFIDGNHVTNFDAKVQAGATTAGKKQLAGVNFWGYSSDSEFYIDEICSNHGNPFHEASSTTSETINIYPDL